MLLKVSRNIADDSVNHTVSTHYKLSRKSFKCKPIAFVN